MDTKERRNQILKLLREAENTNTPISASALSKQFGVSRQVIVGDVALLRASGEQISSTARGYIFQEAPAPPPDFGYIGLVACRHSEYQLAEELGCIADYGGCTIDVIIEHPLYGQLCGTLDIRSRFDAEQFAAKVANGKGTPLSALTDGIHLHHIGCRDEASFLRIRSALAEKHILLPD